MAKFEEPLRERLETHVKAIMLGHIEHIRNYIKLADQMTCRIDVNIEEVQP